MERIERQGRGGKGQKGKMRGHHLHQLLFTIWENRGKMTPVLTSASYNLTPSLPLLPWGSVGSTCRIGVGGSWLIQVATIGANPCLIHTLAHNSKDDPSLDWHAIHLDPMHGLEESYLKSIWVKTRWHFFHDLRHFEIIMKQYPCFHVLLTRFWVFIHLLMTITFDTSFEGVTSQKTYVGIYIENI